MERRKIQIIWVPTPSHANCVVPQNGEANSKRSTNICRTMPRNGIINFISGQTRSTREPRTNPKVQKVFEDLSMELPPERKIEHVIKIKYGSGPANVKPYRYPCHHKRDIESLIPDLLKCGVITKSWSPYAAPVVLV